MRTIVALAATLLVMVAIANVGSPKAHAEENKKPSKKTVEVEKGDTLSKIAKRNETTYPRVYYANPKLEDPDLIYPGDKLRIPHKEEKLKKRPLNETVAQPKTTQPSTVQRTSSARTYTPSAQSPQPAPAPSNYSGDVWDRLAACESGGNWSINTGNGYYGGLQFSLATWQSVGGNGYPHQNSKAEQIKRGKILQARSGWGQWPACSAKLGLN